MQVSGNRLSFVYKPTHIQLSFGQFCLKVEVVIPGEVSWPLAQLRVGHLRLPEEEAGTEEKGGGTTQRGRQEDHQHWGCHHLQKECEKNI